MSKELVTTLLDQAMTEIETNLNALNVGADAKAIEAAIDGPVKAAFKTLNEESNAADKEADTKALYRKFSLKFHPDRLKGSAIYAVKLRELASDDGDLLNIPQQVVEQYKTGVLVDAFENMDASDMSSVFKFMLAIYEALPKFLNEYQRYNTPVDDIVFYARTTLMVGAAVTGVAGLIGIGIVAGVTSAANKALLNAMTGYHYDDELNKLVTRESMATFARNALRAQIPAVDEEPDEDAINLFITTVINQYGSLGIYLTESEVEQILKEEVKYKHSGLDQSAIIFDAFRAAITKPLPGGAANNAAAIMLRFVQCLLVIPALLMDATKQAIGAISNALLVLILAATLLSCAAIVLLTNMPLYIYDAVVATSAYVSSFFENMFVSAYSTAEQDAPESSPSQEETKQSSTWANFFTSNTSEPVKLDEENMSDTASVYSYGMNSIDD